MSRRALRRLRTIVATVALLGAATIVIPACGGGGGSDAEARPTSGAGIYKAYCLTCHGAEGQGFVGPRLAGLMVDKYPEVDDQIAIVTNGTGRMPAFRGNLSTAEIRKVVEYERTDLGQ